MISTEPVRNGGMLSGIELAAPDHGHRLVEEQREPERRQHLVERAAPVERPQDHNLEHDRDQRAADESQEHRQRIGLRPGESGHEEVAAEHEKRAVSEVDDPHDAEYERHPDRHQEQHQPELHAVEKLLEQERKRHDGSISTAAMKGSCLVPPAWSRGMIGIERANLQHVPRAPGALRRRATFEPRRVCPRVRR